MTEEQKDKRNEQRRNNYPYYRQTASAKRKQFIKPFREKYKGFKFDFNEDVLQLEVKLPFRIVKVDKRGVKRCDDEAYGRIQNELRKKMYPVLKGNHIIVIECAYLQLFTKDVSNLEEVCTLISNFITEKLSIYGRYVKNNRTCNADFEPDLE